MNSVAHLSFAGGGLLLPARDPYERELLVEHIVARAQRNGGVRVALHRRAWCVQLTPDTFTGSCARCRRALQATWYATAPGGVPHCLRCAFGLPVRTGADATDLRKRITTRQAGAAPGESVLAPLFQRAGPLGRTAA